MTTPIEKRTGRRSAAAVFLTLLICLTAALAVGLLDGCASAPAQRFYTLGNQAPAAGQPLPTGVAVKIAALTIPELVDRPQIVLRTTSNRVAVLDNQRWAESLKTGIVRVLATDLAAQLGTPVIGTPADRAGGKGELLVSIDITRFDSALDGMVQIDARWTVRGSTESAATSAVASAQEASGATLDEVVAAHDRALGRIAAQIAATVRQVAGQGR